MELETNPDRIPLLPGDRLLSIDELKQLYPKSTSGIYHEIRAGQFPRPVRIGANRVAWIERQVLEHLNGIIAASNDAEAPQ